MKITLPIKPNKSFRENARLVLPAMFDELLSHRDRVVDHPRLKDELHQMRIAGKPLRYAMEIFEIAFGKTFTACLREVKDFIELLGKVHDRDVTILKLRDFIEELRLFNGNFAPKRDKISLRSMRQLIKQCQHQRAQEYAAVCSIIRKWEIENFRQKLMTSCDNA